MATVSPLASDPAIQQAIADQITAQVFTYIDVQGLTTQAIAALTDRGQLRPQVAAQLQALAIPVANGVQSFTRTQVGKIVQSPAFRRLDPGQPDRSFVLFQSKDITRVRTGFNLLDTLGVWLPILTLILLAIGVYVAKDHRRALVGAALGVAAGMVVLALGLAVFRSVYLDAVPATVLPHDAAAVLYDTIVRFLRLGPRTVLVLALVFWGRPTGKVVLGLTLALLVVLAVIEFLGRRPILPVGVAAGQL